VIGLLGKRILLVEDEPAVAMMVEDMLADLGCEAVGPALRLEEAVELARTAALDAAILDVNMGGRDSADVAEALARRAIPFVFATGYGRSGVPGEWAGGIVLQKPYTQAELAEALDECLRDGPG
jgi:CheY-like chemotaxis protein